MLIRRVLILIAILILFMSVYAFAYEKEIKNLSTTITENITSAGKKTVAVVDFTDLQGNVTELGRFLAEELSVELVNAASGFSVIDRAHLKSILAEHKLSISGIADPKAVKKLGQIAGVDAIITGSVTPLENSIRVTTKVIATDTANVIAAAKCDIAKTRAIEELLSREIETAQTATPSASTSSYVPSSQSKKVGDITVTVKRITVANGQVTVMLDVLNHSDKELKLGVDRQRIDLTDEKGNIFEYNGGVEKYNRYSDWTHTAQILNPRSNNDVMMYFGFRDSDIKLKDIGSNFTFSVVYAVRYLRDKSTSMYSVSFTDIKAQLPK